MSKSHDRSRATRPSEEAIAKRAYELSLQRGSLPGHEVDDWLQAEAELMAAAAAQRTQAESPADQSASQEDVASEQSPSVRRGGNRRDSAPATARRSLRQ
jgi:hypothetical protein